MSNIRKILIIGSKDSTISTEDCRIESFGWDEIEKIQNPRDYHDLIVNLLSIGNAQMRSKICWKDLHSKLNVSTTWRILRRGGTLVVIGDPRFQIPFGRNSKAEFLCWTGLFFEWDNSSGDTIYPGPYPAYDNYTSRLSEWHYSLRQVRINTGLRSEIAREDPLGSVSGIQLEKLVQCLNLDNGALVFWVRLKVNKRRTGRIVFLPKINATEEETLGIVLRDVSGVEILAPEPNWVKKYVAPGQKSIDEQISKRRKAIKKEQKRLENDEDKRVQARECLKLLYVGETELELVVWNTLEKLGAKVERPRNPGKEDGWIFIKVGNRNYRGVLEIKSTKSNQFGEDGIGQLAKWKNRGIRLRKEKHKGIFIGNNSRDKPPDQRTCPFADDWRKSADMSEICALTTEYLYKIYLLKSRKKLDINAFWSDVFQTNGIFPIDKYFSGTIPKGDYSS